LNKDLFFELSFPLPPLPEQQRIVDRIESLFAKLDEAKEKAQAVVDGFEDRKAAILHKAFTGELTENWRQSLGYSKSTWEHKRFSDFCDIVRGGSPRPAGDPKYYDGNIPFMKVADITNNRGPYVTTTMYTIKEAGLKKTRMVGANTLLLTNSGATLGVPAICTFQTTFNDGIAAFLNLNSDSLLFFYYFWTSKTQELRAINMGAAQPNLNTNIIGAVEIDLPPDEERQEIANRLDDLLTREQEAKEAAEQVIDQIDSMKKSILARAFRGELGTNDPADESAVELLKRVL
jgi:Restriction endonuclease S subunits